MFTRLHKSRSVEYSAVPSSDSLQGQQKKQKTEEDEPNVLVSTSEKHTCNSRAEQLLRIICILLLLMMCVKMSKTTAIAIFQVWNVPSDSENHFIAEDLMLEDNEQGRVTSVQAQKFDATDSSWPSDKSLACFDEYINKLSTLKFFDKTPFSEYLKLMRSTQKRRLLEQDLRDDLLICAGSGTTGTKSLASYLVLMGLETFHYSNYYECKGGEEWRKRLMHFTELHVKKRRVNRDPNLMSIDRYRNCTDYHEKTNFIFPKCNGGPAAILDTPVPQFFWQLFHTYPNAKFVLTIRNSTEWARSRRKNHGGYGDAATLPYICGVSHDDFDLETNANTLDFHNEFVECVVPKERLLKLLVVGGDVKTGEIGDFIGVDTGRYHDDNLRNIPGLGKTEGKTFLEKMKWIENHPRVIGKHHDQRHWKFLVDNYLKQTHS